MNDIASSTKPAAVATGQGVNGWRNLVGAIATFFGTAGVGDGIGGSCQLPTDSAGSSNSIPGFLPYMHNGNGLADRMTRAASISKLPSCAATTNATSAKVTAGTVHTIEAMNTTAAVKYLKLYNKATAPVVGTDTPVRTIALTPTNVPTRVQFPFGLYFTTGIAWALTGAAADNDSTALAAGDVVGVNIDYN